jgi:hypothetical protein
MSTKLHLHANFPYFANMPNVAIGYLKSFLCKETHVDIRNIYWNLPSTEILKSISLIILDLERKCPELFDPPTLLTAYITRFFYDTKDNRSAMQVQPSIIESVLDSYTSLEKIKSTAKAFKGFVDYSIETENMADVDVAGFTVRFYQWMIDRYIWSKLKDLNPNIKIVVGGFNARDEAQAFLETCKEVDFAVWGEGEVPLTALMRWLGDESSFSEVPQLVYRKDGKLCATDIASCRVSLYPFADHSDYFERLEKINIPISPRIPVFSTRSCRWKRCKFCSNFRDAEYHERQVKDTVMEIEYQSKKV